MMSGSTSDRSNIYLQAVMNEIPRILGLMDRDPSSATFGCMDRTYWAWKFTDFPGARFQEGLCVLSFLYSADIHDNPYYRNGNLLEWITGGFNFWAKIQYSDGSFDEAYPFERSLAATAFTGFYLAEAFNFLNGRLPTPCADRFRSALAHAGRWLCKNDEKHGFLSNHLAAAAAALYHIYQICEDERFEKRSQYYLGKILDHQSTEGWYDEYGGADPGYQTHGSFYLARLFEMSQNDRIIGSLERSIDFLANFVHPDKSIGGEYTSRNTQTYYPAAFEMLSGLSGKAYWIASEMLTTVRNLTAAGLGSADIYNLFPLINNHVFAYLACIKEDSRRATAMPPENNKAVVHFPDAGIIKIRDDKYEFYVGLSKGGVLKAFSRENQALLLNDCGYVGRLNSGKMISSQISDKNRRIDVLANEIRIEGVFAEFKRPVMTPFSFIGFRIFNLTFGRLKTFSYWLKSLLVKVLIYRKKNVDLKFERCIQWNAESVKIRDRIKGDIGDQLESLQWQDLFTTIHMGSSRYFIPNELNQPAIANASGSNSIDLSKLKEGVVLERTIKFD